MESVEQLYCLWQAALLTWWIGKLDSLLLVIDSMRLHTWGQQTALEVTSPAEIAAVAQAAEWRHAADPEALLLGSDTVDITVDADTYAFAYVSTAKSIMLGSDWSIKMERWEEDAQD